tara:strand:- start:252 stop:545 length:294 start_codon:yes stop_codon:yes gene_type:complete
MGFKPLQENDPNYEWTSFGNYPEKKPQLAHIRRDSVEWNYAWGQLLDMLEIKDFDGWQYMGSEFVFDKWIHTFRNRYYLGQRTYKKVFASHTPANKG